MADTNSAAESGTQTETAAEVNTEAAESTASEAKTEETTEERIEKLVQSRLDKALANERKENASLKKKLDKLSKEKLSEDEVKQLEISDREAAIQAKEKEIAEKENRLTAIKAIKSAGLDDGGDLALELADLVVVENDTAETIEARIKTIGALVKKMTAAEVEKTFKTNGRTPNGAPKGSKTENIASKLGKQRAEQVKKSNNILKLYTGG